MRRYSITTYRPEEDDKILKVLATYGIKPEITNAITAYHYVSFECEKKVWKEIKKELRLEIKTVYCKLKVD